MIITGRDGKAVRNRLEIIKEAFDSLLEGELDELRQLIASVILDPDREIKEGLSFAKSLAKDVSGHKVRGTTRFGCLTKVEKLEVDVSNDHESYKTASFIRSEERELRAAYDRFLAIQGSALLDISRVEELMDKIQSFIYQLPPGQRFKLPESPVEALQLFLAATTLKAGGGGSATAAKFTKSLGYTLRDVEEKRNSYLEEWERGDLSKNPMIHKTVQDTIDEEDGMHSDIQMMGWFTQDISEDDVMCDCRVCKDERTVINTYARVGIRALATERPDGTVIPRVKRDGKWVTKSQGHEVDKDLVDLLYAGFRENLDNKLSGHPMMFPEQSISLARTSTGILKPMVHRAGIKIEGKSARYYRCMNCGDMPHVLDTTDRCKIQTQALEIKLGNLRTERSMTLQDTAERLVIDRKIKSLQDYAKQYPLTGWSGNWRCIVCGGHAMTDSVMMTYRTKLSNKPNAVTWVLEFEVWGDRFIKILYTHARTMYYKLVGLREPAQPVKVEKEPMPLYLRREMDPIVTQLVLWSDYNHDQWAWYKTRPG